MSSSISQSINSNYRINPVIEDASGIKQLLKSAHDAKIVNAALPLLMLFRPLQLASTLQIGLINSYGNICNLTSKYQAGSSKGVILNLSQLTLTVALTGLSIFKPRAAIVGGESLKIIENIYGLGTSVYNLQGKQAATKLVSITHSAVFIASLTIATPELIAISLVAQGALELYQAYQEYRADHKIEAAFKFLTGNIRLIFAGPYLSKSYQNALFTYQNHQHQKFIKQTIHNDPRDQYFIVQNNGFVKAQQHTFKYQDISTPCPIVELQANNGNIRFFHAHLTTPVSSRNSTSQSLPGQYLKAVQEQTDISFDPVSHTCSHTEYGKGNWELQTACRTYKFAPHWAAPELDNYSLSLAVNFDKDSKTSTAQIIDRVRIKKSPAPKGTEMTPLKWILERFF